MYDSRHSSADMRLEASRRRREVLTAGVPLFFMIFLPGLWGVLEGIGLVIESNSLIDVLMGLVVLSMGIVWEIFAAWILYRLVCDWRQNKRT